MTALALLLLPALSPVEGLQGPVFEKAGILEYTRPEGWTREPIEDGSVRLMPPGGGTTVLRFMNPESWPGTAEEFHTGCLQRLKLDAQILSGGVPRPFGAFLRSESTLGVNKKVLFYHRLYTVKIGKLWQGVYYIGLTEAGFAEWAAAADGIIRSVVLPGSRERSGGLEFSVPFGWTRRESAPGAPIVLSPNDVPKGFSATLTIHPARSTELSADEYHEILWRALTEGSVLLGRPEPSERSGFKSTRVALQNRAGERGGLVLYTTKRGAVAETLVFACSAAESLERYATQLDGFLAGIKFVPGAVPPPLPEVPKPAGPRPIAAGAPLVGVWLRSAEVKVDGFDPETRRERILLALWEGGLAFRGGAADPILSSPGGIREGLAAVDPEKAPAGDRRFTRWSGTSDGIVVEGMGKLVRDGASLKGEEPGLWRPLAPVDGLRIDGAYASAREGLPTRSIAFRADGSFEVEHWAGLANEAFPAKGKGSYELRASSLILRFDGLAPQALDLVAGFDAPSEARVLLIAGATFVKR